MTDIQPDFNKKNRYVVNAEDPAEITRLINLDREITKAMGGPLAGIGNPAAIQNVIDLGCGPGSWVLDVAFTSPTIDVAGVDISPILTNYARARATSQGLYNASFGIMDITQPLDLPTSSFDLVNARFLLAVLQRTQWPAFLAETLRILRPGGILQLTEGIDTYSTNSPAYERFAAWLYLALYRTGYGFSPDGRTIDITPMFPPLLRAAGYQNIQRFSYTIEISAGTDSWTHAYYNILQLTAGTRAFLIHAGVASADEIEANQHQLLIELNQDSFAGMLHYMSFVARKPAISPKATSMP